MAGAWHGTAGERHGHGMLRVNRPENSRKSYTLLTAWTLQSKLTKKCSELAQLILKTNKFQFEN